MLLAQQFVCNVVAGARVPTLVRALTARQGGWTAATILAVAYVLTLASLSPLALQDYPVHLQNAITMADLIFHSGERFGGMFSYHFLFVPYLLGDFASAGLIEVMGQRAGSAVWISIVALSLPLALVFFMRATGIAAERRSLVFILGLYLATDWFFLMGFLSFRLGVALTIMNLALAIGLRKEWSTRAYLGYTALVTVGYLVHLTTIAFLSPALGVSGLLRLQRRTSNLRTEALLAAPLAALWAWHLSVGGYTLADDPEESPYTWGGLSTKIRSLDFEFVRYHTRWDLAMMAGLAACLLLSVGRVRLPHLRDFAVLKMLVLVVTFVAIYMVLPMGYSEAWYVDVRALALASVCLVLALASLPAGTVWARVPCSALALALAAILVAMNLVYLERHLSRSGAWLREYRAVVTAIPVGAHVFPISTQPGEGNIAPNRHADAFVTIDREGLTPFAFTADNAGPEKYLRYVQRPYAPDQRWYLRHAWESVDWQSVARDYDYVLIEKPFEGARIGLPTELVAENRTAALLAINKTKNRAATGSSSDPRYRQNVR